MRKTRILYKQKTRLAVSGYEVFRGIPAVPRDVASVRGAPRGGG